MSDPQIPLADAHRPVPSITLESLAADCRALRTALHITLVLLILLTGSLFVFFAKETSIARREVNEYIRVVGELRKTAVPIPAVMEFRNKLQAYSQTHPDFIPIYSKYFALSNAPASAGPVAAKNPAQPTASGARLPPGPGK
jgi:hypothetical protein